jgi:hypothetical protein
MVPQALHRRQRFWQFSHHGWPVALETSQGFSRPQIEHASNGRVRQFWQTGPSAARTATRLRRPHRVQSSRLAGSFTRQFGHSGPPSASRAAGSLTAPQREHGTALVLEPVDKGACG